MLTPAWKPHKPHKVQAALFTTRARFPIVCAGRGSGKTELARRRIVRALGERQRHPNAMYFYALPTVAQAKRVAWKPLLNLIPPQWLAGEPNNTEMTVETVFGTSLTVIGMDKPQRAEGVQWTGGVIDECSDQRPGVFDRTVLPALSQHQAWCWRIGVPKRFGIGAKEFKERFEEGLTGDNPLLKSYHWTTQTVVSPEEIAIARGMLSETDFNEQYNATWLSASGLVYHAWDSDYNVTPSVHYDPNLDIVVGSDFNVNPMCWVLAHKIGDQLHVFDEIHLANSNTPAALNTLASRYLEKHRAGWAFFGDATAKSRKSSATITDYEHIKSDGRFVKKAVLYPRANPLRFNRYAAVNGLCCSANGVRRLLVHPRCIKLIADFESLAFVPGTREADDQDGRAGHISDACGYIVWAIWPIKAAVHGVAKVSYAVH